MNPFETTTKDIDEYFYKYLEGNLIRSEKIIKNILKKSLTNPKTYVIIKTQRTKELNNYDARNYWIEKN